VPEHIILKPGPLTPEEFEKGQKPIPTVGAENSGAGEVSISSGAHLCWRIMSVGMGPVYPKGLKGAEIPIGRPHSCGRGRGGRIGIARAGTGQHSV